VLASVVSFGFVGLGLWAASSGLWRRSTAYRVLYGVAGLALLAQVILGGLTVLELLAEWTVASHLVTGNTFCALLLALALTASADGRAPAGAVSGVPAWARAASAALLVAAPLQLALGGLVAGSHAGLACGDWPGCNGPAWFPTLSGLVGLQVAHRAMAYTLLALGVGNLLVQWSGAARRPAIVVLAVLCVQATLGVLNVLWRMPVEITLLHSAGAATVFLSATWNAFTAWSAPVASPSKVASARFVTAEAK
jgi:cytochrome c oxidase assembly protein subunit 15